MTFTRRHVLLGMALGLAGCSGTASYRYKLTLALKTPEGIKTASSVSEVEVFRVTIPARGTMHKLTGEAVYVDLGNGKRPLIALMTRNLDPYREGVVRNWSEDGGPSTRNLLKLYGENDPPGELYEFVTLLNKKRGPKTLQLEDLPDLVTFADINQPKSVMRVDPKDLAATLGPGVSWHSLTIECTDEPLSYDIQKMLPWLTSDRSLLDGTTTHWLSGQC